MYSKERWLKEITDPLKEIASIEFQDKGWIKGEIHAYCRFAGTICRLYEDAFFEDFIDNQAKTFGLSDHQIKKLDQLRNALNAYVDKHGCYEEPDIIVKDPEWHKIRQLAKESLDAFYISNYLDPSKKIPKEALLHLISYFVSPEFQERVWFREKRPNENPFREWMEKFFFSSAHKTKEIIEHFREYEITEEQQCYLIKLYEMLKLYWEKRRDEENLQIIFQDPEWHQIQSFSDEVLKMFNWKDLDED